MSGRLIHIADRVLNRPLMIMPEKLALIASVLDGRIGIDATGLSAEARPKPALSRSQGNTKPNPHFRKAGSGVAIVPVLGSLVNRGGYLDAASGVTSYEFLRAAINATILDDDISTVVLDVDSPGGEAVGAFEIAEHIRTTGQRKPIAASVTGLCCSAAYAIASATSRIVISPSSLAGSIGVVMMHADHSRRLDTAGITPTLIFAGAHKVDGNPVEPLSKNVRADIQAEIDVFYEMFVDTVAKGRPRLSPDAIRETEARTYIGAEAVKVGLADAIGTLGDLVAELSALDKKIREKPYDKYQLAARLHGNATAQHQQIRDAHTAGLRAGMATALSELKR
jgi:capsid assembly protease